MPTSDRGAPLAGRRERLALLIGFGVGSMAWNICWPFLPLRVEAVGVGDLAQVAQLTGFLAGGANLITATLGAFWSMLGERFGYRWQILRAHFGTSLSMGLIGLARAPLELVGAGGMLGLLGGNYPHYMALTAMRTPMGEVGRVLGDMQAAGQIGGTIGPIVGGLIASQMGVSAAFLVSGAVSLTAVVAVATMVRPDGGTRREPERPRGSLRAALARPEQRQMMLLLLAGDAAIQGLRPLIPIVISARLADPAAVAAATGLVTTLSTAGTVVAALAVGRLSRRIAPKRILLVSLPTAVVLVALVPLADGLPALVVLWTLTGLASGVTTPAIFAWLGRLAPSSGGGFALLASASMLAFAIGPMVMGQASVYGLDVPFRLAAGLTLVGVALVATSNPKAVMAQAAG